MECSVNVDERWVNVEDGLSESYVPVLQGVTYFGVNV